MLDNISSKELREIKSCLDNLSSDEKKLSVKELSKLVQEKEQHIKTLEDEEFNQLRNMAKEFVPSFKKLSKKEWKFDINIPLTITLKLGDISPQEFVDFMCNQIHILESNIKVNGTINTSVKRDIREALEDLWIEFSRKTYRQI